MYNEMVNIFKSLNHSSSVMMQCGVSQLRFSLAQIRRSVSLWMVTGVSGPSLLYFPQPNWCTQVLWVLATDNLQRRDRTLGAGPGGLRSQPIKIRSAWSSRAL